MPLLPFPPPLAATFDADARRFAIPGAAVAVVHGERLYGHVFGDEPPGAGRAVDPNTWFSLASTAKHSTAAATLALAAEGLVDLTAPIGRYLVDAPSGWRECSVASLLHHTSGLPEYLAYRPDEQVPERRAEFMARYAALAPVFGEGEAWMYSNTNYILLGFLVAQQRGMPFAEVVEGIAGTLGGGIAVASPAWTRAANAAGSAVGARDGASRRREVIGDGDLSVTLGGAAAWLQGLLNGGIVAGAWQVRLFQPATLTTGRPAPYGCGWFLDHVGAEAVAYHGGHYDGWTSMAYLVPGRRLGVLAMCNLAPGNTRAIRYLAQRVAEAVMPGSTPLALRPIADREPGAAERARALLLRADGGAPDAALLAPEMARLVGRASLRGVVNLWAGSAPRGFELVEREAGAGHRFDRYRLVYDDQTEHVRVGFDAAQRVFWAWPV